MFDPCEPIAIAITGASDDQRTGVSDAIAAWRDRGVTAFELDPVGPTAIEIRFEQAAAAFHGLYDDQHGVVYVNQQIVDRAALAVVVAHELGHAFGLLHVDRDERESVMNPGNLSTSPNAGDQREVEALWGRCAAP